MSEAAGISPEHFRIVVERAGLTLSEAELSTLKPMFDYYAAQVQKLHEVALDAEDLAVAFSPSWDPQS